MYMKNHIFVHTHIFTYKYIFIMPHFIEKHKNIPGFQIKDRYIFQLL